MRLGLDIRTLGVEPSGVGNYVLNLLSALCRVRPQHDYLLLAQAQNLTRLGGLAEPARILPAPVSHESHPWGDLWEHLRLPGLLRQRGVDVFHGPMTLIPLAPTACAVVVTIHDLVPLLFPETVPAKYALYVKWLMGRAVKRAERVIAVSGQTKDDLVSVLGVDPDRVAVVHEAPSPEFRPISDQARLRQACERHGIRRPFLLHLGNLEPRKNQARLARAFLSLPPQVRGQAQLVLSGRDGWLTQGIRAELERLPLGEDVVFTGFVPQDDLPLLMNAALAVVFPSLYEGFGLPALEALACGTPLLTSKRGSLPEIVGQAALLVDPLDERDLAQGLARLLGEPELRAALAQAGPAQAARFSWDDTARQTWRVYEQALAEKRRA